jgi:hypothetical protein
LHKFKDANESFLEDTCWDDIFGIQLGKEESFEWEGHSRHVEQLFRSLVMKTNIDV